MNPLVSIVIPTWNRRELLAECLDAIEAQTFQSFEVIVVDDGSTDDTAAVVEQNFPYVRLVRLPENRGFCAAVNAGIRLASHEFIMLLNNDVTLERDCLFHLFEAVEESDAAILAPLVLCRDNPALLYAAGDRQHASGRPESVGFHRPRAGFPLRRDIFGASAAAVVYRRAVFDTVGLFDECFQAYFEDSDLNFRARLAGFRAELVPEATAYHVGSASIEGRAWWRTRQCCRNHALLVIKNMPSALLVRHGPAILAERVHQIRRLFSAVRAEFGAPRAARVVLSAWGSILAALPHCLVERGRIQRSRAIGCGELNDLLFRQGASELENSESR